MPQVPAGPVAMLTVLAIIVGMSISSAADKPATTQPKGMPEFDPVVERVVLDRAEQRDCFVDFDTGELLTWLARGSRANDPVALGEYKRRRGADAFAQTGDSSGLVVSDVLVARADPAVWGNATLPADVLARVTYARPAQVQLKIGKERAAPATYVFRTREGATGLLQILGLTPKPRGVRIRYKLLRGTVRTDNTTPWGDAFNGLKCRLLPPTQTVEPSMGTYGDTAVYLHYELRNTTDKTVTFLPWFTPLEGVAGHIFRVVGPDGKELTYRGAMAARVPPGPNSFLRIHKRRTMTARVGLQYDFTKPGLYKVSIKTTLDPRPQGDVMRAFYGRDLQKIKQNPENVWTGTINSNTVTVRVVPERAAWVGSGTKAWEKAVAARLRTEKITWPGGAVPTLKGDLRNRGLGGLFFVPSQAPPEVQLDGRWCRWGSSKRLALGTAPLGPGREVRDIPISLTKGWLSKADGKAIVLAAGKHTVRVAFTAEPTDKGRRRPVRAVSNPVEIEILPAAAAPSATQPGAKAGPPAWTRPVNGLRWRVWLAADPIEHGEPIVVNIEFGNVSNKPLRLLKDVNVGNGLYPVLYTSDGGKNVYPIEHGPARAVQPAETVRIGPGRTCRSKWAQMRARVAGPAKLRLSFSSPRNTNPQVKDFWSGHLGHGHITFTIVPTRPETVDRRVAEAKARLRVMWRLAKAYHDKHGKWPGFGDLDSKEYRAAGTCPMTGRGWYYNIKRKGGQPIIRSGEYTRRRRVERVELDASGKITVRRIRTLPQPPKPPPQPPKPAAAEMKRLWQEMGAADPAEACKAVRAMLPAGDAAVEFLTGKLEPVTATREHVRRLIQKLDSNKYAERAAAFGELTRLGAAAEAACAQALEPSVSAQLRTQLEKLLRDYRSPFPTTTGAWRRARGIRALEWIGSAPAERVLGQLAKGHPLARETALARAALRRVGARPAGPAVEKFGVNRGTPIYSGFLFVDGKYVDAPYVVERWGLGVYVNGILLDRGRDPEHVLGAKVRDEKKASIERRLRAGVLASYGAGGGSRGSMHPSVGIGLLRQLLADWPRDKPVGPGPAARTREEAKAARLRQVFEGLTPTRQLFLRLGMKPKAPPA